MTGDYLLMPSFFMQSFDMVSFFMPSLCMASFDMLSFFMPSLLILSLLMVSAAGAVVYCAGEFVESPGYVAPGGCRDTTGAGDAFHGGFLYGFLKDEDLETSLQFANAVAAMKCSSLGARTALPTASELKNFLKNPC